MLSRKISGIVPAAMDEVDAVVEDAGEIKGDGGKGPGAVAAAPTRSRLRKLLVLSLGCVTLGIAGLGGGSYYVAGVLVAPRHVSVPKPSDYPHPLLSWRIDSPSGNSIAAWGIENPAGHATVVLLHPIRANRRVMLARANLCYTQGFSVLMIDLQGHGESQGREITFGYRESEDVAAAVHFARQRWPGQPVGVIGWSLGGAALLLSRELEVDAVVLESVYPTIKEAVRNRLTRRLSMGSAIVEPLLLAQFPLRLGLWPSQLRPIDGLERMACPVMLLAGELDEHTPVAETRRMFEAAPSPKKLCVFEGAAHVDLYAFAPDHYRAEVMPFLRQFLLPNDFEAK